MPILGTLWVIPMLLLAVNSYAAESIRYTLSATFMPKMCDIVAPHTVVLEKVPGSGVMPSADIKAGLASQPFQIGLANCDDDNPSGMVVFISNGRTVHGSHDVFNNNPDDNIGIKIRANGQSFSKSDSPYKPSLNSIVWRDIQHITEQKTLTASLVCAQAGCEPDEGQFNAAITLSFYSN